MNKLDIATAKVVKTLLMAQTIAFLAFYLLPSAFCLLPSAILVVPILLSRKQQRSPKFWSARQLT